jgi:hypothetical protein
MDSTKSTSGYVVGNFYFFIRWDLRFTQYIPVHPRRETSVHYFSCSGGTGVDWIKAHRDMLC